MGVSTGEDSRKLPPQNGSHTRSEPVKTKPSTNHVRTPRKYRKKIQDLCLLSLSLSPHVIHCSFYPANACDSVLYYLSFFWLLLKKWSGE